MVVYARVLVFHFMQILYLVLPAYRITAFSFDQCIVLVMYHFHKKTIILSEEILNIIHVVLELNQKVAPSRHHPSQLVFPQTA